VKTSLRALMLALAVAAIAPAAPAAAITAVDTTPPTCAVGTQSVAVQDLESGISTVAISLSNAQNIVTTPFSPGFTGPVTLIAQVYDPSLPMSLAEQATNGAGLQQAPCRFDLVSPTTLCNLVKRDAGSGLLARSLATSACRYIGSPTALRSALVPLRVLGLLGADDAAEILRLNSSVML
jgi:hypothetical protein